jgi:hypothetical protein
MHVRIGQHSVTFDKMWEVWDGSPVWEPGIEWHWDDYEVDESSRYAVLLYSNPVDRYWEFFSLPEGELALQSRWDRVQDRADDEFVAVFHVS